MSLPIFPYMHCIFRVMACPTQLAFVYTFTYTCTHMHTHSTHTHTHKYTYAFTPWNLSVLQPCFYDSRSANCIFPLPHTYMFQCTCLCVCMCVLCVRVCVVCFVCVFCVCVCVCVCVWIPNCCVQIIIKQVQHTAWPLYIHTRIQSQNRHMYMHRVGQNHVYMVYIQYFWPGNHQIYGQVRCIYTVLANPIYTHTLTE